MIYCFIFLNSWVADQSSYFMWVRDAGVTGSMRLPRLITPDFDDGQDDDVPSSEVSSISVSYGVAKAVLCHMARRLHQVQALPAIRMFYTGTKAFLI